MRMLKKVSKYIFYVLLVPISYLLVSLILMSITVNKNNEDSDLSNTIFLNSNGVHLDVILPIHHINKELLKGLNMNDNRYASFGWGEENFYLNTPTWGDLTFKHAFKAMFLKSNTLIHLTRFNTKSDNWVEVKLSENQLKKLNQYISKSFVLNEGDSKIMLKGKGYTSSDDFYKANGNYSCLFTCNTWVNSAFKNSGLKSCFWTPLEFGLINKYNN
ncbi:TIGR02117 family protein [Thalassobellus citreus]|uniref:TIGR02117 family protein n=1 Tax=Thalassobellus citreus TaxID=3367752 RepID=UPI0037A8389F